MYDTEYNDEGTTKAVARDPGGSSTKQTVPVPPDEGSPPPPEREPGSDATVHKAPAAGTPIGPDGAETAVIPQASAGEAVGDDIEGVPLPDAVSGSLTNAGAGPVTEGVDPISIPDLDESAVRRMPVPDPLPPEIGEAEGAPRDLPDPFAGRGLAADLVADPSRTSIDDLEDVGRFIEEPDRLQEFDRFDDDLLDS